MHRFLMVALFSSALIVAVPFFTNDDLSARDGSRGARAGYSGQSFRGNSQVGQRLHASQYRNWDRGYGRSYGGYGRGYGGYGYGGYGGWGNYNPYYYSSYPSYYNYGYNPYSYYYPSESYYNTSPYFYYESSPGLYLRYSY